jgi:hypothetical protein
VSGPVRWTVRVQLLPSGEVFVPIPDEVLRLAGWSSGDEVELSVSPSGAIVLARPAPRAREGGGR